MCLLFKRRLICSLVCWGKCDVYLQSTYLLDNFKQITTEATMSWRLFFLFHLCILANTDVFYVALVLITFFSKKNHSVSLRFESLLAWTCTLLWLCMWYILSVEENGYACLSLEWKKQKEIKCLPWDAKPHIRPQADLVPEFILPVYSINLVKVVMGSVAPRHLADTKVNLQRNTL